MDMTSIEESLDRILPQVEKPARYTGGEYNSVVKDWEATPFRAVLAFPDIYELGMSNLGLAILYDILNRRPDVLAERVYTPWPDMEAQLRAAGVPLYSLETKHPLSDFDLIGFSLPYEQVYTNVLTMLDLGGVPLLASERDERHPIVIAGGHATYNPDPMADFVDAFVIGEGEEVIVEIVETIQNLKSLSNLKWRVDVLRRLAEIPGVYVPRFYDVEYNADGTLARVTPNVEGVPARVTKRIVPILPPPVTRFIVPFVDVTHNRAVVEIQRGCTRGCRFCHAGMVTRPVRERSVEEILAAVDEMVRETGFEEVALLSLSSSDYSAHRRSGSGHQPEVRRQAPVHLAALAPHRVVLDWPGRDAEEWPADGVHLRAGSGHGDDAPPHQQIHPRPTVARYGARGFLARLADDQAVLYDRPSRRDA